MMEKTRLKIHKMYQLEEPKLIISWQNQDIGKINSVLIDLLINQLKGEITAEINLTEFFSFEGAAFVDNLIQVAESRVWACEKFNLLFFTSNEPDYDTYNYLNLILDLAQHHYKVKEFYTIGGIPSFIAHFLPRKIRSIFNMPDFQTAFSGYDMLDNLTWEGPSFISSYLLWIANKRDLPGMALLAEVPFYLGTVEDPQAIKLILSFLNERFGLGLDFMGLDNKIENYNKKLAQLREEHPEVRKLIDKLVGGVTLTKEEQVMLVKKVYDLLKNE